MLNKAQSLTAQYSTEKVDNPPEPEGRTTDNRAVIAFPTNTNSGNTVTSQKRPWIDRSNDETQHRKVTKINQSTIVTAVQNRNESERLWKDTTKTHRIIISKTDYFKYVNSSLSLCHNITINGLPYSAIFDQKLKSGEIIIPEIYRPFFGDNRLEIGPTTNEVKTASVESATVNIRGEEDHPKNEKGQSLLVNESCLNELVENFIKNKHIISTDMEYPLYCLHYVDSNEPGGNIAKKKGIMKKVYLSFSPCLATKPETEKSKEPENIHYHIGRFIMKPVFIVNKENYCFKKEAAPSPLLLDHKPNYLTRNNLITENRVFTSAFLHRKLQPDHKSKQDSFLVKIGQHYYYTVLYSDTSEHNSKCYVSKHIHNHVRHLPLSQTDIRLVAAKEASIKLSFFAGCRKKTALDKEQITEQVKNALKDVPLSIGRVFVIQVPMESKDDNVFVIHGEVVSISDNKTQFTDMEQSECVFSFNEQETSLQLKADESCLLDGTEPEEIDTTSTSHIKGILTQNLAGLNEQIETLTNKLVLPRLSFERRETSSYHKGVLFCGSNGNGKSHLAVNLCQVFKGMGAVIHSIKPSTLIESSVSNTIANIDNEFDSAVEDYKDADGDKRDATLHVYMIDEIDTILLPANKNIAQGIVNHFKSFLDGKDKINNIIIIGTTNKSHNAFDKAIVREERISLHIEFNNPSPSSREEIMVYRASIERCNIDKNTLEHASILTAGYNSVELKSLISAVSYRARTDLTTTSTMKNGSPEPTSVINSGKVLSDTSVTSDNQQTLPNYITVTKDHFTDCTEKIVNSKKEALQNLPARNHDSFPSKKEENLLEELFTEIGRLMEEKGRHKLIIIETSYESRYPEFLRDIVNKSKGFYSYECLSGARAKPENIAEVLMQAPNQARSLIIVDPRQILEPSLPPYQVEKTPSSLLADTLTNSSSEYRAIGYCWEETRRSLESNTIFILIAPPNKGAEMKKIMHIHDNSTYTIELSDVVGEESELKEFIMREFPASTEESRENVVKLINKNHPLADLRVLLWNNFKRKNDRTIFWDSDTIKKRLEERYQNQQRSGIPPHLITYVPYNRNTDIIDDSGDLYD